MDLARVNVRSTQLSLTLS